MNQHPPNYFSSNGNLLPINCTFPGVSSSMHLLHRLKQVNSINNRCHHYHCNAMPPPTTTSLHFHHRIVLNSIQAHQPLCLSSPSQTHTHETTNKPLIPEILPSTVKPGEDVSSYTQYTRQCWQIGNESPIAIIDKLYMVHTPSLAVTHYAGRPNQSTPLCSTAASDSGVHKVLHY